MRTGPATTGASSRSRETSVCPQDSPSSSHASFSFGPSWSATLDRTCQPSRTTRPPLQKPPHSQRPTPRPQSSPSSNGPPLATPSSAWPTGSTSSPSPTASATFSSQKSLSSPQLWPTTPFSASLSMLPCLEVQARTISWAPARSQPVLGLCRPRRPQHVSLPRPRFRNCHRGPPRHRLCRRRHSQRLRPSPRPCLHRRRGSPSGLPPPCPSACKYLRHSHIQPRTKTEAGDGRCPRARHSTPTPRYGGDARRTGRP